MSADDARRIARLTFGLWSELRKSRIFMTGATGFIGHWLLSGYQAARQNAGLDAKVVLLTRDPGKAARRLGPYLTRGVSFHQGDIRSFTFPAGKFPLIIHGASQADARLNREDPRLVFDTIVDGTRRALAFAQRAKTRRFLYLSSGAVYGVQPAHLRRVSEEYLGAPDVTRPQGAYGEGKRAAELMACMGARAGSFIPVIARGFAFSGPFLPIRREFAIGNFVGDAAAGRPIRISGDGSPLRSYMDGLDLSVWLWTLLLRGGSCRAYNVGSEDAVSIAGLANEVSEQVPGSRVAMARPSRSNKGPVPRYVPSTKRIRAELGLRLTISRKESIARMLQWLSANPRAML